jgi:hypothetical protein
LNGHESESKKGAAWEVVHGYDADLAIRIRGKLEGSNDRGDGFVEFSTFGCGDLAVQKEILVFMGIKADKRNRSTHISSSFTQYLMDFRLFLADLPRHQSPLFLSDHSLSLFN